MVIYLPSEEQAKVNKAEYRRAAMLLSADSVYNWRISRTGRRVNRDKLETQQDLHKLCLLNLAYPSDKMLLHVI